jgi:hypothetical protein
MIGTVLHHLTLNTGHVARTARAEVGQETIDLLLPLIDAQNGTFVDLGLAFDVMCPLDNGGRPVPGAAFFQIAPTAGLSKQPYVMCIGCWKQSMSEEAWKQAVTMYRSQRAVLEPISLWRRPPTKTPPVPWLAVMLMPYLIALDPERIGMLGDMERCLFWALAEGLNS